MLFHSILGFAALAVATPVGIEDYVNNLQTRAAIAPQTFNNLKFYAQHAAAAYCNSDKEAGDIVSCDSSACPLVQANKPQIIAPVSGATTGIGGYVAVDKVRKEIILSVRGSSNIRNFVTDALFVTSSCSTLVSGCRVHSGFLTAWGQVSNNAIPAIKQALTANPGFKVIITGHSLGGAVATLAGAYVRKQFANVPVYIYTYGSPRVGNSKFVEYMTNAGNEWRVTHELDPVPRLPPAFFGYRHVSPEYWLNGGDSNTVDYSIDQIKVCKGALNVDCNGGLFSPDIIAHLHYFGSTAACVPLGIHFKRDGDDAAAAAAGTDQEVEDQLKEWFEKDLAYAKNPNSENLRN